MRDADTLLQLLPANHDTRIPLVSRRQGASTISLSRVTVTVDDGLFAHAEHLPGIADQAVASSGGCGHRWIRSPGAVKSHLTAPSGPAESILSANPAVAQ